jgi:DNA repair protein RadC
MSSDTGDPINPKAAREEPPHYHGHRERLRERFRQAGALSDYELLEMVLFRVISRGDAKPLAKTLIRTFGSFAETIHAPETRLREIKGVGEATITEFKLIAAASHRQRRASRARATLIMERDDRLLPHQHGVRRQGAVSHPVSRQAQPAD